MKTTDPLPTYALQKKIFEKLIPKRIIDLQDQNGVGLNGKQQHGFKKNKSTTTLGLRLQSLIARALDESNYVLMACVFFLVV